MAGSRILLFRRNLRQIFETFDRRCASRQNLFFEFCGLALNGRLASVEIATLSCFNQDFSANVWWSPLPLSYNDDT
jgi:hypothetical protein